MSGDLSRIVLFAMEHVDPTSVTIIQTRKAGLGCRSGRDYQQPQAVKSARAGLILDSSIVTAAEQRGHTIRQILEQIKAAQGEIDIGLSVVTIAELMHAAYRAKSDADNRRRLGFIDHLCCDVPVHPRP